MIKNVSKTAIMLSVCLIQTFSMFATVTGEKLGEGSLEVFVDL